MRLSDNRHKIRTRIVIATGRTLAPTLEPAAYTSLVVPISIAETPFQVGFLARDDAVADGDSEGEREEQGPRASCGNANARVNEKHTEIDGIACPTVDAGCHEHTRGPVRWYWRRRSRKAANARDKHPQSKGDHETPCDY